MYSHCTKLKMDIVVREKKRVNGLGPGLPAVVLEQGGSASVPGGRDTSRSQEIKLFIILRDAVLRNRYDSMVSTIATTSNR